jgi:CheY-like chemotaxis protein/anti-sigma regulatory factor (Ser/Thr protein kinase)
LTDLLATLKGTLAPVAAVRQVELVMEAPEVDVVVTDGDLLTRVLRNLLTNALAFTEAGEVRVGAARSESGSHLEITVRDTGIGIAPEHTERIFDEFFQVPNHLQARRCGTGLGLPYTRQVTQALGGQLRLESTLGTGSTFTVALPLTSEQRGVAAPPDIRVNHVVVLTHDPDLEEALGEMLVGISQRISQAADAGEAFGAIVESTPDLLLLDLRMPDGGGADVLTAIRMNPEPAIRDLPTILMTSVDIEAPVRRAAEPAAAMVNTNGLDRSTLARAIASVLSAPEEVS